MIRRNRKALYCSTKCRNQAAYRRNGGYKGENRKDCCLRCGTLITSSRPYAKFCSRRCCRIFGHAKRLRERKSTNSCKWCGIDITNKRSDAVYCSDKCRDTAKYAHKGPPPRKPIQPRTDCCGVCGASMNGYPKQKKFCSSECYNRAPHVKHRATVNRHARRAAGSITLSISQLGERDGHLCGLCKKPVDMNLSGSHQMGPTIDHIVPVSRGGTNDELNLQLAHRRCNVAKGNRGAVQLLLVA